MPGSIRKRSKESWEIRIDLGRDPQSGKRKFRYETVRGTKKQAEQVLTETLHQRDTGIEIAPTKVTVAEFLDRWLRNYARVKVAPSTQRRYEQIVERLKPHLGSLRLQELRPAHIQATYGRLLADKLAPRTVLHHHRVLREALQHAMRWQFIARNPADAVTPPRPERGEMRALDAAEVHRLLDACNDEQLKAIIFTAVSTGMRQGELLGLRWADLNLDAGTLYLSRAAQYVPGEGVTFRTPKTPRSRRSIALSPDTVRELREHRKRQLEARLAIGADYRNGDLLFATVAGDPLPAYSLQHMYVRVVAKANLAPLRFHDLRHTAATLMLRAGIHPKIVSERLGHSTIAITLDTYSHVLPDMQRDAASALDGILASAR